GEGAGEVPHVELRWRRGDGEYCWLAARYSVVRDPSGQPVALVGVARDVTERKVTQTEAEQRLVELMALYEASQLLLTEFNPQRVLQRVCDLAVERFGLHMAWAGMMPVEMAHNGTPPAMGPLMHARADDAFMAAVRSAVSGVRTETFQSLLREGVPLVHQDLTNPQGVVPDEVAKAAVARGAHAVALLPMPSGEHPGDLRTAGVLAVYADRAGAFDQRQIQALGSLANLASLGIQRARLYHEVAEHARTLEADIAQSTVELLNSEARFQAMFQSAALGIVVADLEGRFLEMNDAFCALLGGSAADLRGHLFGEFMALEEGVVELLEQLRDAGEDERPAAHVEQRYRRLDGQVRWGIVTVSIVRDSEGQPAFAIGLLQDVSEEKEAHAALVQAQRLNVTGQLAAALTHEVKNPLQSVIGCLGLIDEQLGRGSGARLYLQVARQELHRADRILNRLRDLNRKVQAEEAVRVNIMDLLRRVLIVTERQRQDQGVQLRLEAPDDLPEIPVAPDQIEQVLLNLVLNAIEAMPDGGTLGVIVERTLDPVGINISCIDTGGGIPDDVLPHIFDFLYTTKDRGTGMGLFISRSIVRQHNGRLEVYTEPPHGTRFDLWLPEDGE
ncbi:MAG: PAS domain S-box protein, partial [Chloroflexi bacterium]|nr:PAS domain S-box protein [Chloroflexota bacterium]